MDNLGLFAEVRRGDTEGGGGTKAGRLTPCGVPLLRTLDVDKPIAGCFLPKPGVENDGKELPAVGVTGMDEPLNALNLKC